MHLSIVLTTILVCILGYSFESVAALLIYDREAIIDGEIWRLFSSIFIHLSLTHLVLNLLVFIVLSFFLKNNNIFMLLYLIMLLFQGIILFVFDKNMMYYGGISGMNYAFIFYLGLSYCSPSNIEKSMIQIGLLLLSVKVILEFFNYSLLVNYIEKETFTVSSLSHIVGIVIANTVHLLSKQNIISLSKRKGNCEKNKETL